MATSLKICIFALYATALVADISACSGKGEPACEADHLVGVDAKLVDVGIEEVGVQLVQKKTKSKRFQSKSQEVIGQTTGATPGWYMSGVDQSCTAGCAAQGLQCFESQQLANNGDVDSSAEVKALITQLGGVATTTAAPSGTQPSLGTQPPTQPPTQPSLGTQPPTQPPTQPSLGTQPSAGPASCDPRAQGMLTDADTDKDGKCSVAEAMVAAAAMQGASSPEAVRPMIEPMDTDSDGYITCEELTASMPGAPRLIQEFKLIEEFEQSPCSDSHGSNPDVPSFGPSWCFSSSSRRTLSSFDCGQVPSPANENKQRLCYCSNNEAATTTAAPVGTQPSFGTQPPTQPPTQPSLGTQPPTQPPTQPSLGTQPSAGPASCDPGVQGMLTDADTDKDGKCSVAEAMVAAAAMQGASSPEAVRPMIEPMDTDSDGYITCEELTASMAGRR